MAKKSLLPRGFKADAERKAIAFRKELDLNPNDPLCGFRLAEHMKIKVFPASRIFPPGTDMTELLESTKGWSALTMKTKSKDTIIIHNELHAPPRQQSDLMHELAHVICDHKKPDAYKNVALPFYMRNFDKQQEEEANYLGSALQITREGLLWALNQGMEILAISDHYNASIQMVQLRINATGVQTQLNRRRY